MRPLPLVLLMAVSIPAHAATLRSSTTLDRPTVRIADLFDGAGDGADRVLGPGPAPGGRIVVEARQLAAIARQFGVDWRPGSGNDRIVIDRPGKLGPQEAVMPPLHAALHDAGAPDESDIDLSGFTPPLVAVEAMPQVTIEQSQYDATSGLFTAMAAISVEGQPVQRLRLSGRVQEMVDLPVPVRRLLPGAVIAVGDLQTQHLRAGQWRGELLHDPAQAIGMAVRHMAASGQPIPLANLARPVAVQKGARVVLDLRGPGLSLTAIGQAMEPGAIGERITVLNPISHALVEAEITGPDQARVTPGAAPAQVFQR